MSDTKRQWWQPQPTDETWIARVRSDYPEDTASLDDHGVREKYADGRKYQTLWDHLGEARCDHEALADSWLAQRNEITRLGPLAAFGAAVLALWWDDGSPGDVDGAVLQDEAENAGLWHHVERHADGVECEWCDGNEPCGELTEAGMAALEGKR